MYRQEEKEKARKRRANTFRARERARQHAKHVLGYNEREYNYWTRFLLGPSAPPKKPTRKETIQDLVDREVRMFESRPRCSCTMCGNPRSHFKECTRQETKAALDAQEQLNEESIPLDCARNLGGWIRRVKTEA